MSEKKVRESKKDAMKRLLDQLEAGAKLAELRAQVDAMGEKEQVDRQAEEAKVNALLAAESEKTGFSEKSAKFEKLEDDFRAKHAELFAVIEQAQIQVWATVVPQIPEVILKGATLEG